MNCPHCQTEMIKGTTRIQGTLLGLLSSGLSRMKLFFTDARTRKKVVVLQPWIDRQSHCCPRCESVVIQGIGYGRFPESEQVGFDASKEDTTCHECGELIPAGKSTCEKCGWTFKK